MAVPRWEVPCCRFGEGCWRPGCMFGHPPGQARLRQVRALADFWQGALCACLSRDGEEDGAAEEETPATAKEAAGARALRKRRGLLKKRAPPKKRTPRRRGGPRGGAARQVVGEGALPGARDEEPKPVSDASAEYLTITLDMRGLTELGVRYRVDEAGHMVIVGIQRGGLLMAWNRANPDRMAMAGDVVVSVNGQSSEAHALARVLQVLARMRDAGNSIQDMDMVLVLKRDQKSRQEPNVKLLGEQALKTQATVLGQV
mmetsp:Transcript_23488/g.65047  ORF Transcript_23488/g.65047 Transcript_23488/m.65047 type:complete len:258 (-) Transcript_23488:96-869(-)